MLDVKEIAAKGLDAYLAAAVAEDASVAPVAETLRAVAGAAARVAEQIRLGPLSPEAMPQGGSKNSDGDVQKALDLLTDKLFMEALATAPVAVLVSEELAEPKRLKAGAPLVVAIDPLDGSSNIDNNVSIGTIISILPALPGAASDAAHFMQPGSNQRAAGFVVYGPQTIFVLSIGKPTTAFILDPRSGGFVEMERSLAIADDSHEFAINASNYRHWDPAVRAFIDDCFKGDEGRLSRNHNMRWIASMVADAYRIFMRGGVFLYPSDQRKGYGAGRLRLLYEVSPVAFLVEHAGGKATDGRRRILDIVAKDVHERSPLVFGSSKVVETIVSYHTDPKLGGAAQTGGLSVTLDALIFDVDGTLAETEELHRQSFNRTFEHFGLDWRWDRALYSELLQTTGGKERMIHYIEEHQPKRRDILERIGDLHAKKSASYLELLAEGALPLRPGVERLIRAARASGVKLAIATTTTPDNVKALLSSTLGSQSASWFAIAAGDMVARKKPDPAVYEVALSMLAVEASRAIAFEDSVNGVAAARAAGLRVVATPSLFLAHEDLSAADAVVSDLGEPDAPLRGIAGATFEKGLVDLDALRILAGAA